jgi:hypothetical protein
MLVDADRVLLCLKGELQAKRSWGRDELFRLIAKLEVESVLDGDVPLPASDPDEAGTDHEGPLPTAAAEKPGERDAPTRRPSTRQLKGARNGSQHERREQVGASR